MLVRVLTRAEPADISPAGPAVGSPGQVVEIWDHAVQLYDCDAELVESVSCYLGQALRAQEVTVVVATPEHRRDLAAALVENGFDLAAARASPSAVPPLQRSCRDHDAALLRRRGAVPSTSGT